MEFLVAFTEAHGCWTWPTWQVVRDIIKPATAHSRCRYADLPVCAVYKGPATVFGSHCWGEMPRCFVCVIPRMLFLALARSEPLPRLW